MNEKAKKVLLFLYCLCGVGAIGYGMVKENNPIFIIGILIIITAYLRIRKMLKQAQKDDPL